ncbi:AfsR/SARP family transcriptional regulator [Crossiella cryophila]|uniref:DNA-binding SARP family transcriptional activator n=1 Tax=Crossiella cryophila TaxID=43355 RepID=A0A7W7CI96_9PSEU|nr:BTAD domain-containing putative transcriptional regulator [Crossiella cryophila]MBB4681645.1 DNA-binding SARP family transcriptional activator [Crossiella cryophila]
MAGRGVEFRLLGPVEVVLSGRPAPVEAAKHRTLLACLVLRAGQRVEATELVGYLWDDEDRPAHPRGALQTYVRRLRRLLGAELISTVAGGYRLEAAPETADAHRFRQLLAAARQTADLAERTAVLQSALALWRGPALADIASPALRRDYADPLDTERLDALALRFDAELALGRHEPLVPDLWKATAEHPLREEFWRQLMLALYRTQRQAEALETYQRAADVLRQELGVEPSPRLRDLRQSVLTNDPALAAPTVLTTALPAWQPVCQLPPDIGDFVGRDRLGLRIAEELRRGGPVLVSGPPGVGKTALAVRVGHRVRADFPDGQLHVNLHGYATEAALRPTDVLARFLRGLGVPPAQIPLEQEQQAELFRSVLRGRRVLVLLDNASAAEQVLPLLPAEPGCAALVTSRHELPGLGPPMAVDVLRHEDSHGLLAGILGDAEPAALDELAGLCAHLPLALRIAAANLAERPTVPLTDRVHALAADHRLSALSIEGDRAAAVQRAFESSYLALSPELRRLFRYLSLAPGPDVTAYSVAALVDDTVARTGTGMERLAEASLVQRHDPDRYQLHDLLRLYSADRRQLEDSAAEQTGAFTRWLDFYLRSARRAADELYPDIRQLPLPESSGQWELPGLSGYSGHKEWLDTERANLVAAVVRAEQVGQHRESALIADLLRGYFQHLRVLNDWALVSHVGFRAAERLGDDQVTAALHLGAAVLRWFLRDYDQAADHATRAATTYARENDPPQLATALNALAMTQKELNDYPSSIANYRKAIAELEQVDLHRRTVPSLINLGIVFRDLGQLNECREYYEKALAITERYGPPHSRALALTNLGFVLTDLGDPAAAHRSLDAALSAFENMGGHFGQSVARLGKALAFRGEGDVRQCLHYAEQALRTTQATRDYRERALALNLVGWARRAQGDPATAAKHHEEALQICDHLAHQYVRIEILVDLAVSHRLLGQFTAALASANHAVALAEANNHQMRLGQAHTALAWIHLDLGDLPGARSHAAKALAGHRETGHRPGEERTLEVLARIAEAERES